MSAIEDAWKNSGQSACSLLTFHLPELQAEANRLGLKKTGRKGELIDRIDSFYRMRMTAGQNFQQQGVTVPRSPVPSNNNLIQSAVVIEQQRRECWLANAVLAENNSPIQAIVQQQTPSGPPPWNHEIMTPAQISCNHNDNNKRTMMMALVAQDQMSKKFKPEIPEEQADDIEAMLLSHLNNVLAGDISNKIVNTSNNFGQLDWCCEVDLDFVPLVSVYGCELKYPCDSNTASHLVRLSTPARYDVGDESVLDFNVCNSWQIGDTSAVNFHQAPANLLLNHTSTSRANGLLEAIRRILAPQCHTIAAKFDKLVTYPAGSFFKQHRDQRRNAHHFGSIVLYLPCHYKGGQFIVRNRDLARTFSFSADSDHMLKCHLVAFSIDCEQEVTPVIEGCRVALNYQLFYCYDEDAATLISTAVMPSLPMTNSSSSPSALFSAERRIADYFYRLLCLPKWRGRQAGVVLSQNNLDFASLKPISLQGPDRLVYNSLVDCGVFDVQITALQISFDKNEKIICRRLQVLPPTKPDLLIDDKNATSEVTASPPLSIPSPINDDNNNLLMPSPSAFFESNKIEDINFINDHLFEHSKPTTSENQSFNIGAILVRLKLPS